MNDARTAVKLVVLMAVALAASGGIEAMLMGGITWLDAFLGHIQGSLGETSTLACLVGAAFLVAARVAASPVCKAGFASSRYQSQNSCQTNS